jgi:hypothetical protein
MLCNVNTGNDILQQFHALLRRKRLAQWHRFLKRKQFCLQRQNLLVLRQHMAIGMTNTTRHQAQQSRHQLGGAQRVCLEQLNECIPAQHRNLCEHQSFAGC